MPRLKPAKDQPADCFVASLAAELAVLKQGTRKLTFAPRQIIFREGDPGDGIYVVDRGMVEISAVIGGEERRVLSHLGPGEFFGEMAVVDSKPRSATAIAEAPTVLSFIPRDETWQMLKKSPTLLISLMREFSLRMREFDRRYLHEVFQQERLALVGRLAQSIVHDFKNPLNVIGFAGDLACADDSTLEERREAKVAIRRQVDRLANMIGDVLEFTRPSRSPLAIQLTNFRDFIAAIVEDLRPDAAQKSVTLVLPAPPPAIALPLDQQRLPHVFANLIHNALDFTPRGGSILLRFRLSPRELTVEIEDTGPGISPKIAGNLFEPFATHGKAHGTGLGLSICKRIVEDHRGRIEARSEPGRGAIFTFTLPRGK